MTWTRFDLKERGKAAFQRNYWRSVLVALILMIFVNGGSSAISNTWNQVTSSSDSNDSYYTEYFDDGIVGNVYSSGTSIPGMLVSGVVAAVVGGAMLVGVLLRILWKSAAAGSLWRILNISQPSEDWDTLSRTACMEKRY